MIRIQAFISPQSLLDLAGEKLNNPDASSSVRGVYGGVGLLIFMQLVYLLFNNQKQALIIVALFGGLYAVSRAVTVITDGPLGTFGTRLFITETVLWVLALALLMIRKGTSLR